MKRSYKLLFALAVVLMMTLISSTALADTLRFGTVKGGTVNLRSAMSTKSQKLGSYKTNTWIRIVDDLGSWYKVVAPDGKTGYMMKEFVYVSAVAKGIVGVVNAKEDLNLRASGSYNGRVTGTYPNGTPCILLTETGDWYHVTVDGKIGYFNADFINKKYMAYSSEVATVLSANGGAVNLRKGPGKEYGSLGSVKNGSFVMILQEGIGWWKISANGKVGYMDSSFLKDGIVRKGSGSTGGSTGSTGNTGSAGNTGSTGSSGYAVVNNPGVNQKLLLRQAASRSSKALGRYGNGTYVTVLQQGNVWCKVRVDGQTGYMMTEFLKFYGLTGTSVAKVDHPSKTFVYLRNGPSQSTGRVLEKVSHGEKVTILTPGATWSQVRYNGQTGYMMTQFLRK